MSDGINEWRSLDAVRAMMADPERSHRGDATISVETIEAADALEDLVSQTPGAFFRLIRILTPRERDMAIAYFVLRQGQAQVATALGITQTVVSAGIYKALKRVRGTPTGKRKYVRKKPVARETVYRSDPESLGEFRVAMTNVEEVLRRVNVRGGVVVNED